MLSLLRCLRQDRPLLPRVLLNVVLDRPWATMAAGLLLTVLAAAFCASHFAINTDMADMVSPDLPFRKLKKQFDAAFPSQAQTLVAVVDGPTPEVARAGLRALAARVVPGQGPVAEVLAPAASPFFARNGLLFRPVAEVQKLADDLARAQALLGLMAQDPSLPGLCSTLETFLARAAAADPAATGRLDGLLAGLARVVDGAAAGQRRYMSWQEIMAGPAEAGHGQSGQSQSDQSQATRQFLVVTPQLDYARHNPGKAAMALLRQAAEQVRAEVPGVSVRLTGNVALRAADLASVNQGLGVSLVLSLLSVLAVVRWCLGSWRLVAISMAKLAVGIVWTLAFAILAFGRLNIISASFVVLYVGVGIDYSIQFCLLYRDLLLAGQERRQALAGAMDGMANALFVCTATSLVSFLAFVPTVYTGASELGVVAGVGLCLHYVLNLNLLPAILMKVPFQPRPASPAPVSRAAFPQALAALPARHPRAILALALLLAFGSALLLPRARFDANPLDLSDPAAEAVVAAKELFASRSNSPWTMNLLAPDLDTAKTLAARLKALPLVGRVVTLADFVPPDQQAKAEIIDEMRLFVPRLPAKAVDASWPVQRPQADEVAALEDLRAAVAPSTAPGAQALATGLDRLLEHLRRAPDLAPQALENLRQGLLYPLGLLLRELGEMTRARPFGMADLPPELVASYKAPQALGGQYRVQLFPRQDISTQQQLEAFADQVSAAEPEATGPPAAIVGAARAISGAFVQAVLVSAGLNLLCIWLFRGNLIETLLSVLPLVVAMVYTVALTVLVDIPFNFANIIVLPLLIGVGVDYAVLLVYRYRVAGTRLEQLLTTATARGVIFSALATLCSCASMIFHVHRGLASMGLLLTFTCGLMIATSLLVLPAMLAFAGPLLSRGSSAGVASDTGPGDRIKSA